MEAPQHSVANREASPHSEAETPTAAPPILSAPSLRLPCAILSRYLNRSSESHSHGTQPLHPRRHAVRPRAALLRPVLHQPGAAARLSGRRLAVAHDGPGVVRVLAAGRPQWRPLLALRAGRASR